MFEIPEITESNTTKVAPHAVAVNASDLGLPPNVWPRTLPTELGNKQLLVLVSLSEFGGLYRQQCGCVELTIFND